MLNAPACPERGIVAWSEWTTGDGDVEAVHVESHTGPRIELRTLFEEPTVAALAAAVEDALRSGRTIRTPPVTKRAASTRDKLAARLKDLSDDEVETLLRSVIAERSAASGSKVPGE